MSNINSMTPKVAVVVLNWNGLSDTLECLESLQKCNYPYFETILVDNGSSDASASVIPKQFPSLTFIAAGKNLGWAGGNNLGIRKALELGHDFVFLLNNDTIVEENCITAMVAAARQTGACLLHPAIYYYDEPSVSQLDPTAGHAAVDRSQPVQMDHCYGAALFIAAEVFHRVGLMDERFFLQLEETDFFLRAKALGVSSFCAPNTRVLHKESRSFGGRVTPQKTYYIVRNSLLVLSKHPQAFGGYVSGLKKLMWTINGMVSRERQLPTKWRLSDVLWLWSSNATAVSVRSGLWHACIGRFGPRP